MTTIATSRTDATGTEHNPLGVHGIDHIEFFVNDAEQWAQLPRAGCWGCAAVRRGMLRRA